VRARGGVCERAEASHRLQGDASEREGGRSVSASEGVYARLGGMSAPRRPGAPRDEVGKYGAMARDEESGVRSAWTSDDPPEAPPAPTRARARARRRPPPPPGAPKPKLLSRIMAFLYDNLWILFVMYVCGAVGILKSLDEPTMDATIDAIYFIAITVTTVGYGDVTPKTDRGKLFVMLFIITGVAMAGVLMSKLTDWILDAQESAMRQLAERQKAKIDIDMAKIKANVGATVKQDDVQSAKARALEEKKSASEGKSRRTRAFVVIAVVVALGAVAMHQIEDISFLDGCYWSIVTSTTVGYGDVTPKSFEGKLFASVYALITIGIMAWAIGQIASATVQNQVEKYAHVKSFKLTPQWLAEQGGEKGYVDQFDFTKAMLIAMGKVEEADFDTVAARFRELDVNGDATLDAKDLLGQ